MKDKTLTAKQKALALADKLGCSVEYTNRSALAQGYPFEITCEAPHGKCFDKLGGVHEVVIDSEMLDGTAAPCWLALIEDINTGVNDCTDKDCDWCNS